MNGDHLSEFAADVAQPTDGLIPLVFVPASVHSHFTVKLMRKYQGDLLVSGHASDVQIAAS